MTERIRPRPIVCRARPRRWRRGLALAWLLPAAVALQPALGGARASLRPDAPTLRAAEEARHAQLHARMPGSITLAALIERQKAARVGTAPALPPSSAPAALPRRWIAQFGAFSSGTAAEQRRAVLAATAGAPALHVRSSHGVHRVVGVADERRGAEEACARLAAAGAECLVRPIDELGATE